MATVSYSSRGEKNGLQTSRMNRHSSRYNKRLFNNGQWSQKMCGRNNDRYKSEGREAVRLFQEIFFQQSDNASLAAYGAMQGSFWKSVLRCIGVAHQMHYWSFRDKD